MVFRLFNPKILHVAPLNCNNVYYYIRFTIFLYFWSNKRETSFKNIKKSNVQTFDRYCIYLLVILWCFEWCTVKEVNLIPTLLVFSRSVRSSGSTMAAWVWPRHLKGSGIAHSVRPPWRGGEAGTNKCQITWANLSDMTVPLDWERTCYITMWSGCVDVRERSLPERWCGCCVCFCKSQPSWAFLAGESKHTLPSKLFPVFMFFSSSPLIFMEADGQDDIGRPIYFIIQDIPQLAMCDDSLHLAAPANPDRHSMDWHDADWEL